MASDAVLLPLTSFNSYSLLNPMCFDGLETDDALAVRTLRGEVDIVLRHAVWSSRRSDDPATVSVTRSGGPCDSMHLTLLCAILFARWDTAALLLERGARCDLTSYPVQQAFKTAGKGVPYEDVRRELGAYLDGDLLGKADR